MPEKARVRGVSVMGGKV